MTRGTTRRVVAVAGGALAAVMLAVAAMPTRAQVGDRGAVDTQPPPTHWQIPAAPVRTPHESMRLMDVADGFVVDLVAAEPLVQDPIAFAFDARSRLWVLEWAAYNWPLREVLGLEAAPAPPGRLVVLDDRDRDGRMDTRTVFAEFPWPRGFQLVGDGVLIFALPDVIWMRDTDGDAQADVKDVVLTGLPTPVNPHLAPSSPSWTLDNWTYGLQVGERLRLGRGAPARAPAGRLAGQWGMSHDDVGRLYFSYNQDHLRGSLVPVHYATRNPHYTATAGIDVRVGHDNEVWPHAITPGVNRRAQLTDEGRLRVFTANAAPHVYRGDQFPEEFRGNVFVGESAGRLIRRVVLTEQDGIVTGRNAYDGREFFFSHDERVRPVYTTTGPDGALYVADMYRGVIEGHLFLTTFLRTQILARGLQRPFSGMGRIYRIRHAASPVPRPPQGDRRDPQAWAALLTHTNGHWRDLAQRTLVSAGDTTPATAIRTLALTHADARVRLQALWTLDGLDALDDATLRMALGDRDSHVRANALRLAETRLDENQPLRATALALEHDASLVVRRQAIYSFGAASDTAVRSAVVRLLERDIDAPFVADAFVSGLAGRELETLETLIGRGDWAEASAGRTAVMRALATAVLQGGSKAHVAALERRLADVGSVAVWQRLALLEGLAAADGPRAAAVRPALDGALASSDAAVRAAARELRARWDGEAAAPKPADGATAQQVKAGRAAFALCAACHQADGRGLASLAPPLAGAATVTGPAGPLIDIVLQGRDVDDASPSMPPMAALPDEDLAAILTYVRQAWGNAAGPVSIEEVRARRATATRGQ